MCPRCGARIKLSSIVLAKPPGELPEQETVSTVPASSPSVPAQAHLTSGTETATWTPPSPEGAASPVEPGTSKRRRLRGLIGLSGVAAALAVVAVVATGNLSSSHETSSVHIRTVDSAGPTATASSPEYAPTDTPTATPTIDYVPPPTESTAVTTSPPVTSDCSDYSPCSGTATTAFDDLVNIRAEPNTGAFIMTAVQDGDSVSVTCYVTGEDVQGPNGDWSNRWDQLTSGGYIADSYLTVEGTLGQCS